MNPTKEQIQWFWEQCEFKRLPHGNKGYHFENTVKTMNWMPPDGTDICDSLEFLPRIDLNNLFKYAVPQVPNRIFIFDLTEGSWSCQIKGCEGATIEFEGIGEDPALALFQAIYKSLGGKG